MFCKKIIYTWKYAVFVGYVDRNLPKKGEKNFSM